MFSEEAALADSVPHVVEAAWVIPVDPAETVLADHAVVVADGRIHELLPASVARERFPAARRTELPGHALIPGLVNLHTHAAMTLMRAAILRTPSGTRPGTAADTVSPARPPHDEGIARK